MIQCKYYIQFLFSLSFFLAFSLLFSQEKTGKITESGKKKMTKTERAEAIAAHIKKGDKLYSAGPKKYSLAQEEYVKALNIDSEHPLANFKAGKVSIDLKDHITALNYFLTAQNQNTVIDEKFSYYLGYAYQLRDSTGDADSAMAYYNNYIDAMKLQIPEIEIKFKLADVFKRIEECGYARDFKQNEVRVFIDNMGEKINSGYPDYDPFFTADESALIFTSRRPVAKKSGIAEIDAGFYEDIFVSSKNENGEWSKAKSMGEKLGFKTNNAIVGLSFDGQKMFLYRDDVMNGDIFLSSLKGEQWSAPKNMKAINSKYRETSACFSADQNIIYFVSDRPGGEGGKDIYMCKRIKKNQWEIPQNLGKTINTLYDEERVYIHPNGKTLYFSSKGHNSMGGYDIFSSDLVNGQWTEPVNLGYPVNTAGDDISFFPSVNEKNGYYATYNPLNKSRDIYKITFLGPEKVGVMNTEDNLLASVTEPLSEKVIEPMVEVRKTALTVVQGTVKDAVTMAPLGAVIEIADNEKNEIIATLESNSGNGKYLISLPSGKNYGIAVKSGDYLFHSENIILPATSEYQVIRKDIGLKKLDTGSKIILNNVFFDFGKATLRSESQTELDRIVKLLNDYKNVVIEISGHTDNVGSEETNVQLSGKRASAVVDYLTEKGIVRERLEFAGYGFSQPIASNDTEDGRQLNRRTEFKVLRTDFKAAK